MKQNTQYIYHWNRIGTALALLLAVLGLVGYGTYRWLSPPPPEPTIDLAEGKSDTPIPAGKTPGPPPVAPQRAPVHQPPLPEFPAIPAAAAVGARETAETAPTVEAHTERGQEADPAPPRRDAVVIDPPPTPDAVPPARRDPPAGSLATHAGDPPPPGEIDEQPAPRRVDQLRSGPAAPVDRAESRPEASADQAHRRSQGSPATQASARPPAKGPLRLINVAVRSSAVRRFELARSIAHNEPRGDLESIIPDEKGVAAVYCFSEVVGMKGATLHYHWLHNGKRVARVRSGAWGKRWRSHSSKVLNRGMTGQWRVELRGAGNSLLASADFVLE